ncbi:upper zone of growth plate and cartilage matrix associated a isoform X2 [Epinephelus moara]|uniref:upper zone of growth plate and cartilage matrix associated a isoform X2 n=1 Tax=Epinephelus moara TaxID=300413 RepID=UPI00214DF355|nr:upper zone of growth plate and cartilage matrix associated a isoform X2 [Epinephelus moara]
MSWNQVLVVSLVTTLLILTFSSVVESAAMRDSSKEDDPKGAPRQVFMPESDATNFFKRRSRRSTRYYELQAEQRVKIAANERWREYNEEQVDEHDTYTRELHEEQTERSRETHEQYREYQYDGLYPRYYWFH